MKYGKQLLVGLYQPWQSKYVRYAKLKRLITRFELEIGLEGKRSRVNSTLDLVALRTEKGSTTPRNTTPPPSQHAINVASPRAAADALRALTDEKTTLLSVNNQGGGMLTPTHGGVVMYGDPQESRRQQFFEIIEEDLRTINAFYVGKEAELEGMVQDLEKASQHAYLMEWKGDMGYFAKIYKEVCQLIRYQELNREGLRKIVKKFDKVTGSDELPAFLHHLQDEIFATSTKGVHLKERMETMLSRDKLLKLLKHIEDEQSDAIFSHVRQMRLVVAVAIFSSILSSNLLMHVSPFAHRCLAVLCFTITMWALEVIPYFATALMVPVLVVLCQVLEDPKNPGKPLPAEEAANVCLSSLVNHTTILVLGGYAVSAAFSRCEIELQIADVMQKSLGHKPKLFMLAMMYMGLFLSAVISNHTAPVLCLSIIEPIIRDFPPDSPFTKCLLLGLAFGCNFGGMMTPISSMQDALAVGYLHNVHVEVSFGRWIAVAVPLCVTMTTVTWLYLLAVFQPNDVTKIPPIVRSKEELNRRDWVVLVLSLLTIVLWSTLDFTRPLLGDLGIVSLLFITFMFGSGMLTQVDFNSFSWHTLFLLGGGNVLGKAVTSSKLLDYLANVIFAALPTDNFPLLLAEILTLILVMSSFVSHTVAALIIMPLVVQLGVQLGAPTALTVTSAFAVSAAMALPFSSFPNVMLMSTTDDLDQPYLKTKDFVVTGLPVSLIGLAGIGTIGYVLVNLLM